MIRAAVKKKQFSDSTMVNYFSLGLDGYVTLHFHQLRQRRPSLFMSRLLNKLWYGLLGIKVLLLQQSSLDLSSGAVSLVCDGENITIPDGTKGVVVLNVNSYAGGAKIWTDPPEAQGVARGAGGEIFNSTNNSSGEVRRWRKSCPDDGLLEVEKLQATRN